MTGQVSTKWTAWHWRVAIGGLLVMIGGSVTLSGASFFHPYVINDLFEGKQAAFLLYYTITLLSIVVSMMVLGKPMLAKLGPKKMMYVGIAIVALALVGFSMSTANPFTFYLAGALLGLGYGISFQLVPVIWVNNWFVAQKGTALGVVMGGTGIGGMFWAVAIPAVSASMGWRTAYLMAAIIVVVFPAIGTMFFVKNTPAEVGLTALGADPNLARSAAADPDEIPGYTYAEALRSPWVWLILVGILMLGITHGGAQILAIYMQSTEAIYTDPTLPLRSQPASETAFFSSLMMTWTLGLLIFKPLLGVLNDKLGILGAMLLTLIMQSIAFYYFSMWSGDGFNAVAAIMFGSMFFMAAGMSNGTVQPPLLVAGGVGNRAFGQIWSFFGGGYLIGMAIGTPLWGMLKDATGSYAPGFKVAWIGLLGFALLSYWAMKMGQKDYMNKFEARRGKAEVDA
ncbi:MAG: MFS transporter [Dermatophilus congolensis]|nr:MFS transporter [Dermatophilus congolensis]